MSRNTRSDQKDAQRRRTAVQLYRSSIPATEVARQLHCSRSWVYKWVHYRHCSADSEIALDRARDVFYPTSSDLFLRRKTHVRTG